MSGLEIERKFLVRKGDAYKSAAFSNSHIQQGYIPADGATVRVRTRDDKAFLTIKGKSVNGGMTRYEFEKEITLDEARSLLQLCKGGVIDKQRWLVKSGNHTFEVDEFFGDNAGLVMAEVELGSEDESYEKPDFIGLEVTGDRRFYNSHLLTNPFSNWKDTIPEEYR
jgi:CYTH domain-containing protein